MAPRKSSPPPPAAMEACQNLLIRCTTASVTSPTADASVCTAKKLISARSSQDKPWGSKKSKKVFGWSALWSTISATSIWRKKLCSLSTTLLAQKCNLCLRYDLSPMSPGRTEKFWSREWESDPRPADYESAALPLSYLGPLKIKDLFKTSTYLAAIFIKHSSLLFQFSQNAVQLSGRNGAVICVTSHWPSGRQVS